MRDSSKDALNLENCAAQSFSTFYGRLRPLSDMHQTRKFSNSLILD